MLLSPRNRCHSMFLSDNVHGSLDNTSGLDSNLYNIISFNAEDQVRIDGLINEVSINFSTSPTKPDSEIWLFVIMAQTITSNPNSFKVISNHRLTKSSAVADTTKKLGRDIRTFGTKIEILKEQYLAIRFSPGAGNPYSTERNQYYVNFDSLPYKEQTLLFTHCPTKGVAMTFNVQAESGMSFSSF